VVTGSIAEVKVGILDAVEMPHPHSDPRRHLLDLYLPPLTASAI
jgi:hypothetical protein